MIQGFCATVNLSVIDCKHSPRFTCPSPYKAIFVDYTRTVTGNCANTQWSSSASTCSSLQQVDPPAASPNHFSVSGNSNYGCTNYTYVSTQVLHIAGPSQRTNDVFGTRKKYNKQLLGARFFALPWPRRYFPTYLLRTRRYTARERKITMRLQLQNSLYQCSCCCLLDWLWLPGSRGNSFDFYLASSSRSSLSIYFQLSDSCLKIRLMG